MHAGSDGTERGFRASAGRGATIGSPSAERGALMEEARCVDRHGVEVFTQRWPVDAARRVVLIAHGASEHSTPLAATVG